jgi:hypothetical protein
MTLQAPVNVGAHIDAIAGLRLVYGRARLVDVDRLIGWRARYAVDAFLMRIAASERGGSSRPPGDQVASSGCKGRERCLFFPFVPERFPGATTAEWPIDVIEERSQPASDGRVRRHTQPARVRSRRRPDRSGRRRQAPGEAVDGGSGRGTGQ